MFKTLIFSVSLVLMAFATINSASAEISVQACGKPAEAKLNPNPDGSYCNIHSRRFDYTEEDMEFRKVMEERRKNYLAPSLQATQQYKNELKARHGSIQAGQSGTEPENEAFGPAINQ